MYSPHSECAEALVQAAQRSCGCLIPGSDEGQVERGFGQHGLVGGVHGLVGGRGAELDSL